MHDTPLRSFLGMMAGALSLAPAAAHAQAWIGLIVGDMIAREEQARREHACMTGTPLPDHEVAEAVGPAGPVMQAYYAAAQSGAPRATQFHLDKKAQWTGGGVTVAGDQLQARLDAHRDALAAAGFSLAAEPLALVRAGDGASALGQWRVRDTAGATAGTYTALFRRKQNVWKLSQLEATAASAFVEPVAQYCHKPGDVMPYRLATTRAAREGAEKRLVKAETRVGKTDTAAAEARARAEASPKSDAAREKARLSAERARDAAADLAARRTELAAAREAEVQALADAKAAEDAKAAALAALALR